MAQQTASTVDTKLLGRPPTLSGREGEFTDWSFVMKSYLCMVNSKFAEVLPRIENASDDQEPMMSISAIAEEEKAAVGVHM